MSLLNDQKHTVMETIRNSETSIISMQGISLIDDDALKNALYDTYNLPKVKATSQIAEQFFEKLTSKNWSTETLCRFLSGWRSTHGTALFVSGLIIRLLRAAKTADTTSRNLLYEAAEQIGEIIPEDTGVDDTPHQELFARFANHIVGNDSWNLNIYNQPACEKFREYVKHQRLKATIEEGILTTAASENWNTGEYTFFTRLIHQWMSNKLGLPSKIIDDAASYVVVHSGNTELGHFLHAIKAWQLYCKSVGKKADPNMARLVFERYIKAISSAYNELNDVLNQVQRKTTANKSIYASRADNTQHQH